MKRIAQFVKTTVVGGFFVVLPVGLLALLIDEALVVLLGVTEPLTDDLATQTLVGVDVAVIGAVLLMFAVCTAAGLAMRTGIGLRLGSWLERSVLARIPGYTLIKNLTRRFSNVEHAAVALVDLFGSGAQVLGFIVEELDDGDLTVFVPTAPTPSIGFVYLVKPERVRRLDASMGAAVNCLMQWGIGSRSMLAGGGG